MCFIDFRKAFDNMNRDLVLIEMIKAKIPLSVIGIVAKIFKHTSFDIETGYRTYRGI